MKKKHKKKTEKMTHTSNVLNRQNLLLEATIEVRKEARQQ